MPVWELPLERWRETVDANLTATFLTARGFLRNSATAKGRLILCGSTAGLIGEAGHADYAAAKSAILGGLLLSLKNEVVRRNGRCRVNAVAPGWTESPMTRGLVDDEQVRRISRTMALRKVAQPEDVAAQVVALASPDDLRPRDRPGRDRCGRYGGTRRPRGIRERADAPRRADARLSLLPRGASRARAHATRRSPSRRIAGTASAPRRSARRRWSRSCRAGYPIRCDLGYTPTKATLTVGGRSATVTPTIDGVTWNANWAGGVTLRVESSSGWVVYVGRIALRRP